MIVRRWTAGCRLVAAAVAFGLELGLMCAAHAAIPTHGAPAFFFSTRGARLPEVLRDLGANYGVPIVVSPRVDGSFIGRLDARSPGEALDRLASLYQLAWYYDGHVVYVYKADETGSQLVTPSYVPVDTLMASLKGTGLLDGGRCLARAVPGSSAIQVYGVPVCLERVTGFLQRIDQQDLERERNEEGIELFKLKYASATDETYRYRGQQIVVPGVVSVLNQMAQGRTLGATGERSGAAVSNGAVLPTFAADERQNAVIVRDKKIDLPLYAKLIGQLDHRPKLVEVSVTIIDVDEQNLNQLGIDWSATTRIGGGSISFNAAGSASDFSTIVGDTGNFMVRLSALEQNAKARILSRPSVLTVDNMQAVLDKNITFYTKLVSEKVAKLESVSTGALLRVTPRVIVEGGHEEIMLSLDIEDGRQTDPISRQEPLPQTLDSEIVTHAMLKPDQALLLGGFVQGEESEGTRKIPLLGDIPILGRLFGTTQKTNRHSVRLFLLQVQPVNQS